MISWNAFVLIQKPVTYGGLNERVQHHLVLWIAIAMATWCASLWHHSLLSQTSRDRMWFESTLCVSTCNVQDSMTNNFLNNLRGGGGGTVYWNFKQNICTNPEKVCLCVFCIISDTLGWYAHIVWYKGIWSSHLIREKKLTQKTKLSNWHFINIFQKVK